MVTFVAYETAKKLNKLLPPIVEALKKRSADLADQIERASSSVLINLGEGNRRGGKDKRRFFVKAHGSAGEIRAVLELADLWNIKLDATEFEAVLDHQLALLWGLTHSRKIAGRTGS